MKVKYIELRKRPDGSSIGIRKTKSISKYIPHIGVKRGGNPTPQQKYHPLWLEKNKDAR
jgi:hypothetical protein